MRIILVRSGTKYTILGFEKALPETKHQEKSSQCGAFCVKSNRDLGTDNNDNTPNPTTVTVVQREKEEDEHESKCSPKEV